MRIDLTAAEAWTALSDQYRMELGFTEPALQVQVYFGYQHALLEVTHGIARLFSHKKMIAVIEPAEPAFESLLATFAEEGYTIKSVTSDQASDAKWLAEVQNDLLFLLFSEDDPVTGRIYSQEKAKANFKDKRIFLISVSHAIHRVRQVLKPEAFEARILSLRPDRALLIAGGRCRITPPITSNLPWRIESPQKVKEDLSVMGEDELSHAQQVIEDFESHLPDDFHSYFKKGDARVFDRTVVYHKGFDGCALATDVAEALKTALALPGEESPIESTSPCRWSSPRLAQWLINRGESEEIIRGLFIASSDMIEKGLEEKLLEAIDKIRKLQEGH